MDDHARRDVSWPADPTKYPLSGPSDGPTYCPPIPQAHRFNLFTFVLKCALVGFIAFWAYGFFEYFFIPG